MLKCYIIMLNARAVLSKQCPVMLKCYVIMFKNGLSCLREASEFVYKPCYYAHTRVVLFTHILILLKGYVIMLKKALVLYIMLLC